MSQVFARLALYPTLAWNVAMCRVFHVWNWWDQIDPLLFVGARPFKSDVPRLRDLGVRAVVNACAEFAGPVDAYRKYGIIQLHVPTVDFSSPSLDSINTAVRFIDDHQRRDFAVYVHCKAGRGRSAAIALCWLMHAYHLAPAAALRRLQEHRKHVSKNLAERHVVKQFWESISIDSCSNSARETT